MSLRWRLLSVLLLLATGVAACSGDDDDADRTASGPGRYLALGDSISAGGGAPPYDLESAGCFRSYRAWPTVLDEGLPDVVLTDFPACGGATTSDIADQVPQDPDPNATLVTLTIGANDIAYHALLFVCAADCAQSTPEAEAEYRAKLVGLRTTLVTEVYPALRAAYPEAKIVHVGYPRFVTTDGVVDCPWLSPEEQPTVERVLDEINATIEEAASQFDDAALTFVDVTDALAGHELCSADPWVTPLEGIDGAHPDANGYDAIATVLRSTLEDQAGRP